MYIIIKNNYFKNSGALKTKNQELNLFKSFDFQTLVLPLGGVVDKVY
jgi:hypothetical protein